MRKFDERLYIYWNTSGPIAGMDKPNMAILNGFLQWLEYFFGILAGILSKDI